MDNHPPRTFDPSEVHGWNDVIRVDPGNIVEVAVQFDIPGRYVYHCHILEHEDTEMMRPFVVTVTDMSDDGGGGGQGTPSWTTPASWPDRVWGRLRP